jgi:hypothetical protein
MPIKGIARPRGIIPLDAALLVALTTGIACTRTPLGDEPSAAPHGNAGVPPAVVFASVSAGDGFACGLKTDGIIVCWGDNSAGQATPPTGRFVSLSADGLLQGLSACAVRADGTIACWGDNPEGQWTPPTGTFASVSIGFETACGLRTDGTIACWGDNFFGQATPPGGTFASVSAGDWWACGVRTNRTITCWGAATYSEATPQQEPSYLSAQDHLPMGVPTLPAG